jgi:thioredoxin reductase
VGLALSLRTWSHDVVLCTDGPARLSRNDRERLARLSIPVYHERIRGLEGGEELERLVFASGRTLARSALFFSTGQFQRSSLAAELGCAFNQKGAVKTGRHEDTGVEGLYVAGDASRDAQLVIVAAAEGAKAAIAINKLLQAQEQAPNHQ